MTASRSRSAQPAGLARVAIAETERIVAWLRLPAIGLIAASQALPPNPSTETLGFWLAIGLYGGWALVLLIRVHVVPAGTRLALASMSVDVVAITVLAGLSGGPFSQARLAYFLIPAAVAFRFRPGLTAAAAAAVVAAYLVQGFSHPGGGPENAARFILVQAGYLAWFGVASVLGAVLLGRRTQNAVSLAEQRGVLLAELIEAEERERRRLSEGLHDSAVQNLLVARQASQEAQDALERDDADGSRQALAQLDGALAATVEELRNAIFELHPYVLEQAGLESAVAAVGRRASERGGFALDLDLDHAPRSSADAAILAAARELLANAVAHAGAESVRISLRHESGLATLVVSDDGDGFDQSTLPARLAAGHIGLASQRMRAEALGGRFELDTGPGRGTTAKVVIPTTDAVRDEPEPASGGESS